MRHFTHRMACSSPETAFSTSRIIRPVLDLGLRLNGAIRAATVVRISTFAPSPVHSEWTSASPNALDVWSFHLRRGRGVATSMAAGRVGGGRMRVGAGSGAAALDIRRDEEEVEEGEGRGDGEAAVDCPRYRL